MTTTHTEAAALESVNPADLVIGANVRLDARLDKAFIASIAARGVIEPIVAYRDQDGVLTVIAGQRRTLAAVQVGRDSVPVIVQPEPQDTDRLIDQLAENEHRAAVTRRERVIALDQLALLGMSAAQIAKQTATPRAEVKQALVIAQSAAASQAVAHADLTLDQAAVIAQLEDDPHLLADVMDKLADPNRYNSADFVLRRAVEERDSRRAQRALTDKATAAGLTVVPAPAWNETGPHASLTSLRDADNQPLTIESHAGCPGTAVYPVRTRLDVWADTGEAVDPDDESELSVREDASTADDDPDDFAYDDDQDDENPGRATASVGLWITRPACADWSANGHQLPRYGTASTPPKKIADMDEAEAEAARAARSLLLQCNRDWPTAEAVRLDWVTTLLTRKTLPKDAGTVMATILTTHRRVLDGHGMGRNLRTFATLLGLPEETYGSTVTADYIAKATNQRAHVIALAVALAGCESQTSREDWRTTNPTTAYYLRTLQDWGYNLSEVEARAAGTYADADADADADDTEPDTDEA